MSQMNIIQAVNSALDIILAKDSNVCIFGEDVGYFGEFLDVLTASKPSMESIECLITTSRRWYCFNCNRYGTNG